MEDGLFEGAVWAMAASEDAVRAIKRAIFLKRYIGCL
jgi:hypothetical protein